MKSLVSSVLLFTFIMAFWMRGWWNPGVPLTPREENIAQLAREMALDYSSKKFAGKLATLASNIIKNTPEISRPIL